MTIDANKYPNSGGLIINQYFGVYAQTDSIDTITGAIVTLGGMGVAGNINSGGNITTSGNINAGSNVTVGSNLVVSGNTVLNGNLYLVGQSQLTGNLSLAGNLFLTSASGTAYINGNPVVTAGTSGTTVISALSLSSTDDPGSLADTTTALKNSGGATIAKRLFVGGNVVLSSETATPASSAFAGPDASTGALVVKGGATVVGNLVIGGKYGTNFTNGPTDSTGAAIGTLQVNGGAAVLGQMNVTGPITLNAGTSGGTTYTGGLLLTLPTSAEFPSGLAASSGTDLQIGAGGANYGLFISQTTANVVVIPSTATASTTTGALVVKGGVGVSGGIQAGGNIVAVSTTSTSTVNTGSFVAKGGAGINGILIVGGNIVASSTTESYSTTTGSLVTKGGLAVGGNLALAGGLISSNGIGTNGQVLLSTGSGTQWGTAGAGGTSFTGGAIGGVLNINNITAATSSSTGALTVTGGTGLGGNVYLGDRLFLPGTGDVSANIGIVTRRSIQSVVLSAFSGTVSATSGVYTASVDGLSIGSQFTINFAGTATSSGTALTVSAVSAGALNVGSVVTFPGFAGTYTTATTTLTIVTATAGAIDVGSKVILNAGFTASRLGTVMTVATGGTGTIFVGMVVSALGTVVSFGTGTGYSGTYNMNATGTVASAARTGTVVATITALGTGTGGTGTYTIDLTGTTGLSAAAVTLSSVPPTRTISVGSGGVGSYTLGTGITAATTAITSSVTYTIATTTSTTTGTFTPAITLVSSAVTSSGGSWTAPAGVYSIKASVFGGAGGGEISTCTCNYPDASGGVGGYASGVYAVTPGSSYAFTIGLGGAAQTNTPGAAGGSSSFGSFLSATGGSGTANGQGAGGTLANKNGGYAPQPLGEGNSNGSASAAIWTLNYNGGPGRPSFRSGGLSGAVLIEYIG